MNAAPKRVLEIGLVTFLVSCALGAASKLFLSSLGVALGGVVLAAIVAVGIVFDIVGTAVTAADEGPLHAMAAKRVTGAKHAIRLIRNADRVANFCNDMVGDVCGTISGAAGAGIVYVLASHSQGALESTLNTVTIAAIAAVTVSGKAAGKGYALAQANGIIFRVGQVLAWLESKVGLRVLAGGGRTGKSKLPTSRKRRPKPRHGQTS